MNLSKLAEPFDPEDIEWRVSHADRGQNGIYCLVVAYITARAIMKRLDEVCGPENWRNEEPRMIEMSVMNSKGELRTNTAFAGGISIRINDEWVTKWDVSEPTAVEPAKGGFSGAMKRAGAQWGIGRYLYRLDETFAEVTDQDPKNARFWTRAKLKDGGKYWWKAPGLPAFALPKFEGKDEPKGITPQELDQIKKDWRPKFAPGVKNQKELREGFASFVTAVVGEFPLADPSCWTHDALNKCRKRIQETKEPGGVSGDVPFE